MIQKPLQKSYRYEDHLMNMKNLSFLRSRNLFDKNFKRDDNAMPTTQKTLRNM